MKIWILAALAVCSPLAAGFSGSLKSSTDSYAQDLGEPTDTLIPFVQLEMSDKHKFSKRWRTQWKVFASANPEAEGQGGTENAPFSEQTYIDVPEGFIEGKWKSFRLRAGMDVVNWGVVDGYSPSNVVNTSAYFHPLRTPKRGAPMVEAQIGGEGLNLQGLYIPWQRRAVLPATDSRWLPRDVLVHPSPSIPKVHLPDPIEYTYGSEIILDRARRDNFGFRLASHLGSWDFQVTHFDGASPFPKIRPTLTVTSNLTTGEFDADSPIRLDPVSYRIRNSGAGAVYAGEKWIYRLEAAYTHVVSSGYGLDPYSWTAVAGTETNVSVAASTVTLLAQYYHSETPTRPDNYLSSSNRLFDRTAVLGVRWPVHEDWTVNLSALLDTQTSGWFWTAGFEQKLKDALKWGLSWRDFSARDAGQLKTFEKNDHVNLELSYFF